MKKPNKVILTGFGRDYRAPRIDANHQNLFYGMPVARFSERSSHLLLDYSSFVLADKVIMDAGFFDRLIRKHHPLYERISSFVWEAHEAGRIELVDFESVISKNRELLDRMLETDLNDLEPWVQVLLNSQNIWKNRVSVANEELKQKIAQSLLTPPLHVIDGNHSSYIRNYRHIHSLLLRHSFRAKFSEDTFCDIDEIQELLKSKSKRRPQHSQTKLRSFLAPYLSYVNLNIVLSNHFRAPVSDWSDISPFYEKKFLAVGKAPETIDKESSKLKRLFTVFSPHFEVTDNARFLKLLDDKRVQELRDICAKVSHGEVDFDPDFSRKILLEAFREERKVTNRLKVISLLTSPSGLIPAPEISLGTQITGSLVSSVVEKKTRKSMRWAGLVCDFTESQDTIKKLPFYEKNSLTSDE